MTRTDPHPAPPADGHEGDTRADDSCADDTRTEGPSVTETVATTATGMVIGGAALWFLAPICFVC